MDFFFFPLPPKKTPTEQWFTSELLLLRTGSSWSLQDVTFIPALTARVEPLRGHADRCRCRKKPLEYPINNTPNWFLHASPFHIPPTKGWALCCCTRLEPRASPGAEPGSQGAAGAVAQHQWLTQEHTGGTWGCWQPIKHPHWTWNRHTRSTSLGEWCLHTAEWHYQLQNRSRVVQNCLYLQYKKLKGSWHQHLPQRDCNPAFLAPQGLFKPLGHLDSPVAAKTRLLVSHP